MQGTFIVFKPNRKGGFDVRTVEGKRGRIEKRRGTVKAVLTRDVSLSELRGVCGFVQQLNEETAYHVFHCPAMIASNQLRTDIGDDMFSP